MIDLKNTQLLLDQTFKNDYNFEMEFKLEDDFLNGNASIEINGFDDSILLDVTIYNHGVAVLNIIFDTLELNAKSLTLVNTLNAKLLWFKSSVNNEGFFNMNHVFLQVNDETDFLNHINFLLAEIVKDENMELILPITKLTK
jgi:hypothetical protein